MIDTRRIYELMTGQVVESDISEGERAVIKDEFADG